MKFAVVLLLALVAMASAHPRMARSQDKRFLVDTFKDIGNWFSHAWDSAKDEFNKVVHSVEVKQLVPLIDSQATEAGCSTVCTGAAASLLGPAAPLAATLCGPLCKAALAELEKVAG
ncbi:hypothetical protein C0Q70_09375 [Pomacea canaliculata]|uniref:Uncharacterized protein n=1 Tax=Pomacea canaliculata TaxID=400727 RepID=A0A2T7P9M2_POMCA|nr:hypothetical protein C0Q70_09375 [Pomacea canaliculata]